MLTALVRWAKALGRIILRRMTASGVPVNREQRRRMARQLYRDVQRYRRNAATAAAAEIRAEFPQLTIPPIREYPVEAIEKALANAVEPPKPVHVSAVPDEMPQPMPREPAPETSTAHQEPKPEPPKPKREEPAAPTEHAPAKPEEPAPRSRARVTVAAPNELDDKSRRQGRARVIGPTPENRTNPVVVSQVAERVSATMERHMRQAARDLVVDTAEGSGEEIGWARVLNGEKNCGFCAMLASRGPVYHSDKSALTVVGQRGRTRGTRQMGEAYHDHCDCSAVLVRKGKAWDGQQQFEHLERLWMASDALASDQDEETRLVFNRIFRRTKDNEDLARELQDLWDSSTAGVPEGKKRRAFSKAVQQNPPAALEAARSPRRAAA